jgi:hypothetical protein
MEDDKLDSGRMMFFLKLISGIVMLVGMFISLLSFYILMLSIYLLVEKNTEKIRTLLLIGYSPAKVALPYQVLTIGMNATVLLLATLGLSLLRSLYMQNLSTVFPQMNQGSILSATMFGVMLFLLVSLLNITIIRHRINQIWKN